MTQLWIFIIGIFLAGTLSFSSYAAEAGTGVLSTDRQLGHVFGGEAYVCGPIKRETCAQPQTEGPLSEIILWDEWGSQTGTPKHVTPGSSWSAGKGMVSFRSDVRMGD